MEQLLELQTLQFDRGSKSSTTEARLGKVREGVPESILAHYERLVLRGKKGVAIVRHGVCSECHLRIPSGTLAGLVSMQDVHLCDNCGRYLYLPAEEMNKVGTPAEPSGRTSPKQRLRKLSPRGS